MRNAVYAGRFYSSDKKELEKEIKNYFLGKFGPRELPKKTTKEKIIYGVISPHAGYHYSGQAAAYSYKKIAESKKSDTIIVLGTNHTGYIESNFAVSLEDFLTPLGIINNDEEFSKLLIKSSNKETKIGDTERDKIAHQQEHSIEVQLPFLQFILKEFTIVPIIAAKQDYESCKEFAKIIISTAQKLKRNICLIASSDFTHYGSIYGFTPFASDVKKNIYELDKKAIDFILKFKTKEFLEYCEKTTICGAGAIAVAIEACKILGSKKAELLKYYTSADISGENDVAVGYASIAFE